MPVLLVGNLLYTWAIVAASVTLRALRQVLVPREILGRVTASWRLGGQSVTLIGGVLAGAWRRPPRRRPAAGLRRGRSLTLLTVAVAWLAGLRRAERRGTVGGAARQLEPPGRPESAGLALEADLRLGVDEANRPVDADGDILRVGGDHERARRQRVEAVLPGAPHEGSRQALPSPAGVSLDVLVAGDA